MGYDKSSYGSSWKKQKGKPSQGSNKKKPDVKKQTGKVKKYGL